MSEDFEQLKKLIQSDVYSLDSGIAIFAGQRIEKCPFCEGGHEVINTKWWDTFRELFASFHKVRIEDDD